MIWKCECKQENELFNLVCPHCNTPIPDTERGKIYRHELYSELKKCVRELKNSKICRAFAGLFGDGRSFIKTITKDMDRTEKKIVLIPFCAIALIFLSIVFSIVSSQLRYNTFVLGRRHDMSFERRAALTEHIKEKTNHSWIASGLDGIEKIENEPIRNQLLEKKEHMQKKVSYVRKKTSAMTEKLKELAKRGITQCLSFLD